MVSAKAAVGNREPGQKNADLQEIGGNESKASEVFRSSAATLPEVKHETPRRCLRVPAGFSFWDDRLRAVGRRAARFACQARANQSRPQGFGREKRCIDVAVAGSST